MSDMQHVIEIVDIEYPSPLNGALSHIILSRSFFRDSFSKYKHNKSTLKAQPPHQVQPHIPPVGTVSLNADENDFALLPLYASEASFSSHNVSLEDQLASYGLPPAFGRQNNRQRGNSNRGRARQGRQASQEPERRNRQTRSNAPSLYYTMRGNQSSRYFSPNNIICVLKKTQKLQYIARFITFYLLLRGVLINVSILF
ncbi:unnamed protein product [Hymenolepis diminuta]|uniref:Uncharacterized protein n=1 Tax=Hymenolepis diminuta TaxID=6216 RepID=A0A564Z352_HYMDI|nr:unnamed protein product [Hymenolepis diminuta]